MKEYCVNLLFVLGIVYIAGNTEIGTPVLSNNELGNQSTNSSEQENQSTISNETLMEIQNAASRILYNITREISLGGNLTMDICPPESWITGVVFGDGKAEGEKPNLQGFHARCLGEPSLPGSQIGEMALTTANLSYDHPLEINCQSDVGSFVIGMLAKLHNRWDNRYLLYMGTDIVLICGGLPENTNYEYHWRLACMAGTAMCSIQSHVRNIEGEDYTTGVTIGCCKIPELFSHSATSVVLKAVQGAPTFKELGHPNPKHSVCLGGDYLHAVKVKAEVSGIHRIEFECGTLLTRENRYPLLDLYDKLGFPKAPSTPANRIVKCSAENVMIGVSVSHFGDQPVWNPICRPSNLTISSIPNDNALNNNDNTVKCPDGHAMCGMAGKRGDKGVAFNLVCCPIEMDLCETSEGSEQVSTGHCNVVNTDSICTIEYKVGAESTQSQSTQEETKNKFKAEIKAHAGIKLEFEKAKSIAKGKKIESKKSAQKEKEAVKQAAKSTKEEAEANATYSAAETAAEIVNKERDTIASHKDTVKITASTAENMMKNTKRALKAESSKNSKSYFGKALEYVKSKAEALMASVSLLQLDGEEGSAKNATKKIQKKFRAAGKLKAAASAKANYDLNYEAGARGEANVSVRAALKAGIEAGMSYETEKSSKTGQETSNKEMASKIVTASFQVPSGGRLLAFQKVLSCGSNTVRSNDIVNIVVPTNICEAWDELVELPDKYRPMYSRSYPHWHINVTLNGLGLLWNKRPKLDVEKYIKFPELKERVPENFYQNAKLTPSFVTGFNWKVDHKDSINKHATWDEYKSTEWSFKLDVTERDAMKAYRIVGKCGDDWTVAIDQVILKPYEEDDEDLESSSQPAFSPA